MEERVSDRGLDRFLDRARARLTRLDPQAARDAVLQGAVRLADSTTAH
jgi:hypothetical protein